MNFFNYVYVSSEASPVFFFLIPFFPNLFSSHILYPRSIGEVDGNFLFKLFFNSTF
jgi:hypothetical protein